MDEFIGWAHGRAPKIIKGHHLWRERWWWRTDKGSARTRWTLSSYYCRCYAPVNCQGQPTAGKLLELCLRQQSWKSQNTIQSTSAIEPNSVGYRIKCALGRSKTLIKCTVWHPPKRERMVWECVFICPKGYQVWCRRCWFAGSMSPVLLLCSFQFAPASIL